MPMPIVYDDLVSTQAVKSEILSDIQFQIDEKEYAFEGNKRTYLRMSARKTKAKADVSSADAQIGAFDNAISVLPDGDIKNDLVWQRTQAIRKKENAERVLATVDESAIVLAYQELEAGFNEINALGLSLTNIGGIMPAN